MCLFFRVVVVIVSNFKLPLYFKRISFQQRQNIFESSPKINSEILPQSKYQITVLHDIQLSCMRHVFAWELCSFISTGDKETASLLREMGVKNYSKGYFKNDARTLRGRHYIFLSILFKFCFFKFYNSLLYNNTKVT